MNINLRPLYIWVGVVLLLSCTQHQKELPTENSGAYYSTKHLIDVDSLLISLKDTVNRKIIDIRKPNKFSQGHIRTALNVWRPAIQNGEYPYGGMMASKYQIEMLFSQLGIQSGDELILYDDKASCDAARLWWILKEYGFENTKILNGGLKAWGLAGGDLTNEIAIFSPSHFVLPSEFSNSNYASMSTIKLALDSSMVSILDTRTLDEYSGKRQKKGASSGGRIPTSLNIDWANAIEYNGNHTFKPFEQLQKLYGQHVLNAEDSIYVYCHSGVRSAHTTFVLTELLGYKHVKNYDGSWTEWSYFKDLPIEQDSVTTLN